jgi:HD-GYP domain-containing protein (c-di-GMP phosphodiesterase class II)
MLDQNPKPANPVADDAGVVNLQPRPLSGLATRAGSSRSSAGEERRALTFTLILTTAAAVCFVSLASTDGAIAGETQRLGLLLVALGLASEFLSYDLGYAMAGSVASIPYSAAVVVSPHSSTVSAILVAELITQILYRRTLIKSTFNIVQAALTFSLGALCFRALSSFTFHDLRGAAFGDALFHLAIPISVLVGVTTAVNAMSVSTVVAVSRRQPILATLGRASPATWKVFVPTILLCFYLAWLSANLGLAGTVGLVLPMVLARQLLRTTVELTKFTEELLDLMVAAIEARDPYTSGHSKRVAKGSTIIAKALGLRPREVERVAVAALLHDVGKIDERFAPILAKEGRLTPEEWAIMKTHPVRSAELVGKVSSLRDIVGPVRHHHENWDGSGYPDGLKGEEIPLAARIIMFADTLDAITTDRPYRRALGLEDARAEFLRFRGRQFDPAICDRILAPDVWKELYQGVVATNRGSKEYTNSSETELLHFKA